MMRPTLSHAILVSIALLSAAALRADTAPANSSPPAAQPTIAPAHDRDATELGEHMDNMGDAFKKLRKQVADPAQNASSLQLVDTMRKESLISAKLTPAKTQDLPEAERAKFVADYQEHMKKLLGMLDQLKAALKANDNATAEKLVKDLGAFQRESHHQFRKPEKKHS